MPRIAAIGIAAIRDKSKPLIKSVFEKTLYSKIIMKIIKKYFMRGRFVMETIQNTVPIYHKITLTIREAAEYSNIGINKIDQLTKKPNCPFVLYVGTKKLVKRKEFEKYISNAIVI